MTISTAGSASAACSAASARDAFEPRVAGTKDKTLHPPPAGHQREAGREQMFVVEAGRRIDEMDRRQIAFAAACRGNAAEAADGDGARAKAPLGQRADHDVERDIVAAHDDEVGRALGLADQRDLGRGCRHRAKRPARRSPKIRRPAKTP